MKLIIAALFAFFCSAIFAKDVYVKPHVRKDGTYVQGHYRTAPDNNLHNNYSTRGNVNLYTGKEGTVDPDKQQQRYQYQQQKTCYKDIYGCEYSAHWRQRYSA